MSGNFVTAAGRPAHLLAALILTAGCAARDAPTADEGWLDYFEVVDTVTMADGVIRQLLVDRATFPEQPWRLRGVGSEPWLLTPEDGARVASALMGYPPDHDVPYWPSWARTYGARTDRTVFAAATFTYVVRMYGPDGASGDSISTPPPSWMQGERPGPGQFAAESEEDVATYLSGLTVITGLAAVSESVLIVAHGRYRRGRSGQSANDIDQLLMGRTPSSHRYVQTSVYVNVFVNGARVVTDEPAPGEILGYAPGRVVFGRRLPGEGATRLTEYAWKRR